MISRHASTTRSTARREFVLSVAVAAWTTISLDFLSRSRPRLAVARRVWLGELAMSLVEEVFANCVEDRLG